MKKELNRECDSNHGQVKNTSARSTTRRTQRERDISSGVFRSMECIPPNRRRPECLLVASPARRTRKKPATKKPNLDTAPALWLMKLITKDDNGLFFYRKMCAFHANRYSDSFFFFVPLAGVSPRLRVPFDPPHPAPV